MSSDQIFAERALGEKLPISVATAVPFEKLYEDGYNGAMVWMLNMHTLFRNLHGCVAPESRDMLPAADYVYALVAEMRAIVDIVKDLTKGIGEVIFYLPTYKGMGKTFPKANLRGVNTDRQRAFQIINTAVLKPFIDHPERLKADADLEVIKTDIGPPRSSKPAMIITHHAVDLLYCPSDTILLESHTGTQKKWVKWYTKLMNGNQMTRIPFNRLTLQVFGDNTDFSPMKSAVKEVLLLLAEERQWGPHTTDDRVAWSIRQLRDHYAKDVFLELLKA